jgi:hypothetical protein
MKKFTLFLFGAALVAYCAWLLFCQRQLAPKKTAMPHGSSQTTNVNMASSVSSEVSLATDTNAFVRPGSIDEETWNRIMQARPVMLADNQPVEFYARVLDQNEQPVEGAKLTISLERLDEKMFTPTNYLHWDRATAYQKTFLDLYSDAKGWIKFTGATGRALRIEALVKQGYTGEVPNIGSFVYKSNGQHKFGYAGMEDAFNPDKGYVFHLQKE